MGDKFKKKRQEAIIKGFREAYSGISMGATVENSVCSICGASDHDHEFQVDTDWESMKLDNTMKLDNFMVSMVPAPKCETCGKSMEYLKRSTDWACQNEACSQFGVSVTTGIGGIVGSSVE